MKPIREAIVPVKVILPPDGHYFFGYYDNDPWNEDETYHLCQKVDFIDRLPKSDDNAELGAINLSTGEFTSFSKTTAWNFQQGCFLQWYGKDSIIYNIRTEHGFATEIKNIGSGDARQLPFPIANLSPDRRFALSLNFSRIYDFRSGYGYAGIPDPGADINAPKDDGIRLIDTETGELSLIIDYARLKAEFPDPPYSDCKLVVNHINFNPSGTAFVYLLRNFPSGDCMWKTMLMVSDLKGNVRRLTDYCMNSHYHWRDDNTLLIFGGPNGTDPTLTLFDVNTGDSERIEHPLLTKDIHCNYSPNRHYIIGDGYPDQDGYRPIHLYDTKTKNCLVLAKVFSLPANPIDIRCDLHVRWNHKGTGISFDSTHNGKREICTMDLSGILH